MLGTCSRCLSQFSAYGLNVTGMYKFLFTLLPVAMMRIFVHRPVLKFHVETLVQPLSDCNPTLHFSDFPTLFGLTLTE